MSLIVMGAVRRLIGESSWHGVRVLHGEMKDPPLRAMGTELGPRDASRHAGAARMPHRISAEGN
jgi:hypothetical protein